MKKLLLIAVAASVLLAPMHAQAFDGAKKGFILGLGAGYGSAKQTVSVGSGSASATNGGVATVFKIGAGINDQFLLYYSNRVVFFSADTMDPYSEAVTSSSFMQGMSALAGSYYLTPEGPSAFVTGELGVGVLTDSDAGQSDSGFGFGLGAGYDFGNHFVLEAGYQRASVGSESIGSITVDTSISNFSITASWLGF